MNRYAAERRRMVAEQIAGRGLSDARLLSALEAVPRHVFVPPKYRYLAYRDGPLPIGFGQTISQPYIAALMTHLLALGGEERVLEVGTGSGYQAAILAHLSREVHTIEFIPELAARAGALLRKLGLTNVHCHTGDGSLGWPEAAPYAAILVTAAAPAVPQALLAQLGEAGRLVLPVGGREDQELEIWERRGEQFAPRKSVSVTFVPLRGEHGWKKSNWW